MRTRQPEGVHGTNGLFAGTVAEDHLSVPHVASGLDGVFHAEPRDPSRAESRPFAQPLVIGVQDGHVFRRLVMHDMPLGLFVGVEGPVPVQVIGRQVRHHGQARTSPDPGQPVQLEAGKLEDHGTGGARRVIRFIRFALSVGADRPTIRPAGLTFPRAIPFNLVEHGPADVPAHQRIRVDRLVQRPEKAGRGGLSVAARDADDRPAAGLEDQVDLGGQRNAPVPRQLEKRTVVPDGGPDHHEIRAGDVLLPVLPEHVADRPWIQCGDGLPEGFRGQQVGDGNVRSPRGEIPRGRGAAGEHAEPQYGNPFAFEFP